MFDNVSILTGELCPEHISAQQRSQYWPAEWHRQSVLGSLLAETCSGTQFTREFICKTYYFLSVFLAENQRFEGLHRDSGSSSGGGGGVQRGEEAAALGQIHQLPNRSTPYRTIRSYSIINQLPAARFESQ